MVAVPARGEMVMLSARGMGYRLLVLARFGKRLKKLWVDWRGTSGQVYFEHRVAEYERMWRHVAQTLNAEFVRLADDVWELRRGERRTRICNFQLEYDNPVVLRIAGNKPLIHRLLASHGLPVPDHAVFRLRDLKTAYEFLAQHPAGCVIKPADGFGGKGVTTHILTRRELRNAALLASLYSPQLLVEPQIPGECFRLLVLNGRVVDAVCRRGLRLTGDGVASIAGLIERHNAERRREGAPAIDHDRDLEFTLRDQGLTLGSVPANDATVLLKSVNDPTRKQVEVRTVYSENVLSQVSPHIIEQAEAAARIVGSNLLGVDIIARRIDLPLKQTGGVINEVNTTPALHHHYDARREAYPPVALLAVSELLDGKGAADRPAT
jgi:cyanophycin synthetase